MTKLPKYLILIVIFVISSLTIFRTNIWAEKVNLPSINDLLKEAGYLKTKKVQIHLAALAILDPIDNSPEIESYFFIFSILDKNNLPEIKKIKVIAKTLKITIGINLFTLSPVIEYLKCSETSQYGCEKIQYILYHSDELCNFEKGKYPRDETIEKFGLPGLPPPIISKKYTISYMFNYETRCMNEADEKGTKSYMKPSTDENLYKKISKYSLMGVDDLFGEGKAQIFIIYDNKRIPIKKLYKIYPK